MFCAALLPLHADALGDDVLGKLGSLIGEDHDKARSAASASIPALLAGLAHLGSTREGAAKLASAVDQADEHLTSRAGSLTVNEAHSMLDRGRELLGSLFGSSSLSGLGGALGKFTGMGSGSTTCGTTIGGASRTMGASSTSAAGCGAGAAMARVSSIGCRRTTSWRRPRRRSLQLIGSSVAATADLESSSSSDITPHITIENALGWRSMIPRPGVAATFHDSVIANSSAS